MAGRRSALASRPLIALGRSGMESSTTSMARLSRRKPWMNFAGLTIPNCSTMSACTVGVAVAVSASTGAGLSAGRYWPSIR